jgi:hypothetical protein
MSTPIARQKEHHGVALRCPVCSHDHFHEREYALRSPAASFFNHFWSLDETTAYTCAQCGYMLLFAKPAEATVNTSPLDAVTSRVL